MFLEFCHICRLHGLSSDYGHIVDQQHDHVNVNCCSECPINGRSVDLEGCQPGQIPGVRYTIPSSIIVLSGKSLAWTGSSTRARRLEDS